MKNRTLSSSQETVVQVGLQSYLTESTWTAKVQFWKVCFS